jgi:para-aminobenzoate synthetase component II
MVLLIDNYDSFTFNLAQYLGEMGHGPTVKRNDEITLGEIEGLHPDRIVISPGPGRPEDAGVSVEVIRQLGSRTPILGVCLGHQAIGYAFGGSIVRATTLMHGKTSSVQHDGRGVFAGVSQPFVAGRYHSLIVAEPAPEALEVAARTDDGVIMGLRHREWPIHGVQFHPESILTEGGHRMLANWLAYCGWARNDTLVRRLENEVRTAVRPHFPADPAATGRTSA